MQTTIVTSYYITPSKHKHEKYAEWIANFMSMRLQTVIFVDATSHAVLSALYPESSHRKYRILPLEEFTVAAAANWKADEARDHEKSVGHTAPLYQIWHEKAHMVERVIRENPYGSQWFGWVDIGCFRSTADLARFSGFPRVGTATTVPHGKITMLQIEPFVDADRTKLETVDERFRFINRVGGTMFFGDAAACLRFTTLHKATLAEFAATGAFAGKDQSIYAFMVLRMPELFNMIRPGEAVCSEAKDRCPPYDKWFYLHEYLSDAAARLRIAIVGPGIMPIPPTGWGAVEILIWDYAQELQRLGHVVKIVNTRDRRQIVREVREFAPDFVHLQYDEYIDCMAELAATTPATATTSHYGYLPQEARWRNDGYARFFHPCQTMPRNAYVFALTKQIADVHLRHGLSPTNLVIAPNGANSALFKYTETPTHTDRSIYLAKIDPRKRQALLQDISGLWFAGNIADHGFNPRHPRYLGEWSKETLYRELTNYGNLVLLSDGEADPLVVKEAMIAGLGVVLSECAVAGIDTSKPWVTVVPESRVRDRAYVEAAIAENRRRCITMRAQIREYGLTFAWSAIVPRYVGAIWSVLASS